MLPGVKSCIIVIKLHLNDTAVFDYPQFPNVLTHTHTHTHTTGMIQFLAVVATLTNKRHDLKQNGKNIKCVLFFSTTVVLNIFRSEKHSARYDLKCVLIFM